MAGPWLLLGRGWQRLLQLSRRRQQLPLGFALTLFQQVKAVVCNQLRAADLHSSAFTQLAEKAFHRPARTPRAVHRIIGRPWCSL